MNAFERLGFGSCDQYVPKERIRARTTVDDVVFGQNSAESVNGGGNIGEAVLSGLVVDLLSRDFGKPQKSPPIRDVCLSFTFIQMPLP